MTDAPPASIDLLSLPTDLRTAYVHDAFYGPRQADEILRSSWPSVREWVLPQPRDG
jgi:hypothetical protein